MASHVFDLAGVEVPAAQPELLDEDLAAKWAQAESVLLDLAASFPLKSSSQRSPVDGNDQTATGVLALPEVDARYRTLVEQIPAVVFMAFLNKGIGEARKSKKSWDFRRKSGSMIPCVGTNRSTPPIKVVGASKRRSCFSQASR